MAAPVVHGGSTLPSVTVDAYNAELRDQEGFIGDRASNRAFRSLLDDIRDRLQQGGGDPLGDTPTAEFDKAALDELLASGPPEVAAVIHTAIEDFAQEFATVLRRFMRLEGWEGTERLVVGGGLRDSRVGELAISRAQVLLQADGIDLELVPIRHHPDEAGLLGGAHLVEAQALEGHDTMLAMDIGGTNARAGLLVLNLGQAADLSRCEVECSQHWRHRDENPERDEAVARLVAMLEALIEEAAARGHDLAPLIAIGCPGLIAPAGHIERGGHNLPGDWQDETFNLPDRLIEAIPTIGGADTQVIMHNDAVVQGLSEAPFMRDVCRWGVMTIGTGLGNARFTNRR